MNNDNLLHTLLYTLHHDKLLPKKGGRFLVAVSGGMDSVALLHALCACRGELGLLLHVATLNHRIRATGERDVRHVVMLCQQWDVPYTMGDIDVPDYAQRTHQSLETAAREQRYGFLARVALEQDIQTIVTAHHANDQAETLLMHLLRGTGLRGLQGMSTASPMLNYPHLTLIRPLLGLNKHVIKQYVAQHDLEYHEDETNADPAFVRNYIRHEVWRVLERVNPAVQEALLRLSQHARVDAAFIEDEYTKQVVPHIQQTPDRWAVSLTVFREWHEALQRLFVLRAYEAVRGSGREGLHSSVAMDAVKMGNRGVTGNQAPLADGVRLHLIYDEILVERVSAPLRTGSFYLLQEGDVREIRVEEAVILKGWRLLATRTRPLHFNAHLCLPINAKLQLRTRQTGDDMVMLGMRGKPKKLKQLMIDRKIPQLLRGRVPILEVNGDIGAILLPKQWVIAEAFAVPETCDNELLYWLIE